MTRCQRSFDEALISGHLDGALPQAQAQAVRLHLEDCAACRALHEEMSALRETARTTHFTTPGEGDWPELPRTRPSWLSRSLGWAVLIVWVVVISTLALWRVVSQSGDPLEVFLTLGLPGGLALLFVSVLLDRLRDLKSDRYGGIHR